MNRLAREMERQQAAQRRAQQAAIRNAEAAQRAHEKAVRAAERAKTTDTKERRRLYLEARAAEVEAMNASLGADIEALETILADGLKADAGVDFASVKRKANIPAFDPGHLALPAPPPQWATYAPEEPTGVGKVLGKAKYEQALAEARARFDQACAAYAEADNRRSAQLESRRRQYTQGVAEERARVANFNAEINSFRQLFEESDPEAIRQYFGMVLESSGYPNAFPAEVAIAYVPDSRQLVIERELPTLEAVSAIKQYRFVKTKDEITSTKQTMK